VKKNSNKEIYEGLKQKHSEKMGKSVLKEVISTEKFFTKKQKRWIKEIRRGFQQEKIL
jgi:hypothetical protein